MSHLVNSPLLTEQNPERKDKITLKMKELVDAQQLQKLLASKQQEEEENKEEQ